jgi:hypothetical protein
VPETAWQLSALEMDIHENRGDPPRKVVVSSPMPPYDCSEPPIATNLVLARLLIRMSDVRLGSLTDISLAANDVCFTPESGHRSVQS